MKEKVRVLHLWKDQSDAERLVRELANTGIDFEARLVNTPEQYVSALMRVKFQIIIADDRADLRGSGPDELTAFEIAQEISPGVPFVLIEHSCAASDSHDDQTGSLRISAKKMDQLGPLIRAALPASD